jgi:hypothetical protein
VLALVRSQLWEPGSTSSIDGGHAFRGAR